jgi:hypothetical protein
VERRVKPLSKFFTHDYIPFLGGRPGRDLPITNKDIVDLKIDLWTTASVDEFLGHLEKPE